MRRFIILFVVLMPLLSYAQLTVAWETDTDCGYNKYDEAELIKYDSDGNVYLTGLVYNSTWYHDVFLVKLDSEGTVVWTRIHDLGAYDKTIGLETDESGNIYVGAVGIPQDSTAGKYSFHLIKYDKDGNELYDKDIKWFQYMGDWNEITNIPGRAEWMKEDKYGRFVMGGYSQEKLWKITLDKNGSIFQKNIYDVPDLNIFPITSGLNSFLNDVNANLYGGYIQYKYSDSPDSTFLTMYCINHAGELSWTKKQINYNGDYVDNSWITSTVSYINDQNMYIALSQERGPDYNSKPDKPLLIKMHPEGDIYWQVELPEEGDNNSLTIIQDIALDSGGNIWAAGVIDYKFFIARYSAAGQLLWSKTDTTLQSGSFDIRVVCDGKEGIVSAPDYFGNVYVRKYDEFGEVSSELKIAGINISIPVMTSDMLIDDSGSILWYGERVTNSGNSDLKILTITDGTTSVNNSAEIVSKFSLNQNYPNPFNPSTNITFSIPETGLVTLEVYNLLGQKVAELVDGNLTAGTHEVKFDGSEFSSGVYLYRLNSGSFSASKKMILIK